MKLCPWIVIFLLSAALSRAQDDLPSHAPGDSLDLVPKLMPDNSYAEPTPAPSPGDCVAQCQAVLLRAEQQAADSEELFKEGILAKVELEARFLRIVQARSELADAVLAADAAHADAVQKSFAIHQSSQSDVNAANAALETARTAAGGAAAEWAKAQLDAATLDLERKRKLYSEGVCSRRELQLAGDRVALLSGSAPR